MENNDADEMEKERLIAEARKAGKIIKCPPGNAWGHRPLSYDPLGWHWDGGAKKGDKNGKL